jgi:hypothetical protein
VEVTLRLTLTMTTKTKVSFWIELPEEQIYSLVEFDVASEPSSWIDVDDVEIEGDAIGEGGYVLFRCTVHVSLLILVLALDQCTRLTIEDNRSRTRL